jgi:hypothetical protein
MRHAQNLLGQRRSECSARANAEDAHRVSESVFQEEVHVSDPTVMGIIQHHNNGIVQDYDCLVDHGTELFLIFGVS